MFRVQNYVIRHRLQTSSWYRGRCA